MFETLRQDARRLEAIKSRPAPWYVVESLLFENGFQAVVLYRLAHWLRRHGVPLLPLLVARVNLFLTGVDIAPRAEIGPGLFISHGVGIVIGGYAKVGSGALILHQVTLGSPSAGRVTEMPRVGDNAFLGAGAKLIGGIEIGDDVVVGPNAVVTRDIPAGSRVLSAAGIEVREAKSRPPAPPASETPEPTQDDRETEGETDDVRSGG